MEVISAVEQLDYSKLYNEALIDPSTIDDRTLSLLIDRYPYAQSLRFIQAQKCFKENGTCTIQDTLLYTSSPHWLYGYLVEGPTRSTSTLATEQPDEITEQNDLEIPMDHPVAFDFLAYAEQESAEVVPIAEATPHEKVSLYNDDHLPYSFLWWLNKTRMEHAHTYQPYVSSFTDRAAYEGTHTRKLDDEQLLDQQIRENIFHLQAPEEKLSEKHRTQPVPFKVPQNIDPIIERFIREEPQIKPPQADKINLENKARKSAEDQSTVVSETLANIYAEQSLYPKAISIYKKLSLKYPEKSAYFAARIAELTNKLT